MLVTCVSNACHCHDTPYAGHLGRDRTKRLIMQTYWWPMLDRDVSHFLSTCNFCQSNKSTNEKPAGLLQPLPITEFRLQSVSMDFITELPQTKAGHTASLAFVDRLSEMVHFAPCWNDVRSRSLPRSSCMKSLPSMVFLLKELSTKVHNSLLLSGSVLHSCLV